ncbi:hypothetical protein BDQ17DRAFT_1437176 [Cyathus striatus]|nr:hypothetical protein BDQ17DRAFT_1437176 [Cyathus striatus]
MTDGIYFQENQLYPTGWRTWIISLYAPGATSEDYNNESNLKDFIAENAEAWYKHVLEHDLEHNRHGIYRHSLYLVTGNIKSKSWGIATTSGITSLPFCSLTLEESSDPEQPAYTWNNEGLRLSSRTGPNPISR